MLVNSSSWSQSELSAVKNNVKVANLCEVICNLCILVEVHGTAVSQYQYQIYYRLLADSLFIVPVSQ